MRELAVAARKYALYGPAIELDCSVPALLPQVARLLAPFSVGEFPIGFAATVGVIRPYDETEVIRRLPTNARAMHRAGDLTELYQHDDRFWVIDDRWGMCEINVLRGQWRSWVLPHAKLDAVRITESAILWPLAQLLKGKGIYLVPAASFARDGMGMLLLAPFGAEPELVALRGAGYRLVGQRWTVVREDRGRLNVLHVPGRVEHEQPPRLRTAAGEQWVDLTEGQPGVTQQQASLDAVLVAEAGRRPRAHLRQVIPADAANLLRRCWPVTELHPSRRYAQLPTRLAQGSRCFQLQLSRDPRDMLALLDTLRSGAVAKRRSVKAQIKTAVT